MGQKMHRPLQQLSDSQRRQSRPYPLPRLLLIHPRSQWAKGDILLHIGAEKLVFRVLQQHPHPLPPLPHKAPSILNRTAIQQYYSGSWPQNTQQMQKQGSLACAVVPQKRQPHPPSDAQSCVT